MKDVRGIRLAITDDSNQIINVTILILTAIRSEEFDIITTIRSSYSTNLEMGEVGFKNRGIL
jgi:hypothetical protein